MRLSKKAKHVTASAVAFAGLMTAPLTHVVDRGQPLCNGSERWDVKVVSDTGQGDITTKPEHTTIAELNAKSTSQFKIGNSTERLPIENQVYQVVNCRIHAAFREADNDIHLWIEDPKSGAHMIAEIPDPTCPQTHDSEFLDKYKTVRATFLKYADHFDQYKWDITGVLFIDKKHGTPPSGNADNCIELHPVIAITPHS